ncbi:hypothetical protein SY88_02360 [Clostridiales bacterium PH28_bin88]|nr:hypothetical protein SY88_02360 [Clostridiales bacterium PH28_bin88]
MAIASSTANTGGMLATALMQPLLGFLLDLRWQGELVQGTPFYSLDAYRVAIYACFLVSLVGFAATLLVKETYTKNTWQDDRSQVNVRGSA